jgi:two-component system KDP operon response regulator KdpE
MTRKTILIVDDDPELRLGLNIRLSASGYNVLFAADGVSSIAATRNHAPDLILLDLGLPAGDGFTVLERLAASEIMSLIPVLVLSARDRHANRDRVLKAGARAFLQKPVEPAELLAAIRRTLGEEPRATPAIYDLDRAMQQSSANSF